MVDHVDDILKVGATREAAGLTWTLYKNQFGIAWKAGPLAHNLRAEGVSEFRLEDKLVKYATFEKAAAAAAALRRKDVEIARALVDAWDAAWERGSHA